jgi:hydroxylaminobenzene mutase
VTYGATYGGGRVPPVPPYPSGPPGPFLVAPPPPTMPYPAFVPVPSAARPRPSSAAVWSLVLGIVGVATAPLFGGIVPGVLAVTLASSARREIVASEGWLTGTQRLEAGRALGWIAIWVAVTMAVALAVLWLIGVGDTAVHPTYPDNVD